MSDTTIEMTAPYRSCEKHQDESWLEDCLHCQIESLQGEHKAMLDLIERGWKCPNNCDDGWIEDSDVLLEYTGPNTNCPDCAERDRLLGVKG